LQQVALSQKSVTFAAKPCFGQKPLISVKPLLLNAQAGFVCVTGSGFGQTSSLSQEHHMYQHQHPDAAAPGGPG
jgi:hypothetical protein